MPEWLLKKDNYIPQEDKDSFIDKSIISILKVLTKFRLQTNHFSKKAGVNSVVKVLSAIITILFTALSKSMIYVFFIIGIEILFISLMSAKEIKHAMNMLFSAAFFTFIILIPSIIYGNVHNSIMIIFKVISAASCIHILSYTSDWNEVAGAFKIFLFQIYFYLFLI